MARPGRDIQPLGLRGVYLDCGASPRAHGSSEAGIRSSPFAPSTAPMVRPGVVRMDRHNGRNCGIVVLRSCTSPNETVDIEITCWSQAAADFIQRVGTTPLRLGNWR